MNFNILRHNDAQKRTQIRVERATSPLPPFPLNSQLARAWSLAPRDFFFAVPPARVFPTAQTGIRPESNRWSPSFYPYSHLFAPFRTFSALPAKKNSRPNPLKNFNLLGKSAKTSQKIPRKTPKKRAIFAQKKHQPLRNPQSAFSQNR